MDINSQPDPEERLNRFYALVSATIGVLSLCAAIIPALGCMMGVAGIFLGIFGRRSDRKGLATTGISFSIIGILIAIIYSLLVYLAEYSDLMNTL